MGHGPVGKLTAMWDGVLPFAAAAAASVILLEVFTR